MIIDEAGLIGFEVYTLVMYYSSEMQLKDRKTGAFILIAVIILCIFKNLAILIINGYIDFKNKRKERKQK